MGWGVPLGVEVFPRLSNSQGRDYGGDGDNGDDGGDGDGAPCCSQLDWFGSNDGLEARL